MFKSSYKLVVALLVVISGNSYSQMIQTDSVIYVEEDWPPFLYKAEQNESIYGFSGLNVDILHQLFTVILNLPLEISDFPWKRAQQRIKSGRADILITVPTKKRLQFTVASKEPILSLYMHIYTYKNHPKLKDIKRIKTANDIRKLALIPVAILGNGWHNSNIDSHNVNTTYVPKDEGTINYLISKRADILIDTSISIVHELKETGQANEIVNTGVKFGPINYHLLMGKASKHIDKFPKIDAAITKMKKNKTIERLTAQYSKSQQ